MGGSRNYKIFYMHSINTTIPDRPLRSESHIHLRSTTQSLENLLWWFPSLVPLFTIALSFYIQEWYWGLMDDGGLLSAMPSIMDRFKEIFWGFLAFGEFKPTFALHQAIFYSLFPYSPISMHILKWVEACLVVVVWGAALHGISGKRSAALIFAATTLSFHYLYDTFFFLSTHEFLGMLFCGLALNCFLKGVDARSQFKFIALSASGILLMAIGFGAKEPLVAVGVAFGIGFLILGWADEKIRSRAVGVGAVTFFGTVVYALALMRFAQGAYTSSYSFTNFSRMVGNMNAWLNKDFANHVPWLVLVLILGFASSRPGWRRQIDGFNLRQKWGIFTGILLYGGYLMILLPWSTTSYLRGSARCVFCVPCINFCCASSATDQHIHASAGANRIPYPQHVCFAMGPDPREPLSL